MNVALWIVAGLLALVLIAAGAMKLIQSRDKLAASGQGWAMDFPANGVKAIGALEVLGGIGLILPAVLNIAPILVPVAAAATVVLMIGAAVVHARRKEYPNVAVNVVLAALALFVAIARFGAYSF